MSKDKNKVVVENMLNREENALPFGLCDPKTKGRLQWFCNYGINGSEIVSVYCQHTNDKLEKDVKYLESLEQAKYMRDELIKNGWVNIKLPEIIVNFNDKTTKS